MRVLLVRHAEAVPLLDDGVASDFHRPLTQLGLAQAAALANTLDTKELGISVILTSPLVRAVQTAEALVNVLTPGREFIVSERLALGELKPKKLSKLAFESGGTPCMVGHMPDIGIYAAWLLGTSEDAIDFEKAAVACINCRHQIAKGSGVLEWLVTPNWYLPPTASIPHADVE